MATISAANLGQKDRIMAVGIDVDDLGTVDGGAFLGLQNAVGHARRGFKTVLSPEVGYSLVFPEGALLLRAAYIHVANGSGLLIHGHAEQRGQREIDGTEEIGVHAVEVSLCPHIVVVGKPARVHVEIYREHVRCTYCKEHHKV